MKKMDVLKGFKVTWNSVREVFSDVKEDKSFRLWGFIFLGSLLFLIFMGVIK